MVSAADGRRIDVVRDTDGRRYRASVDGEVVAEAEFLLTPDLVVFTHTEIDQAFEGLGAALIRWALDDVRANGYWVVAACPSVRSFITRHEDEYGDLRYRPPPDESAAS